MGARAGANQHVHWFLGGKGLGIQQGTSVWVGSPKSGCEAVSGKFLGIAGQDPSDTKSSRLHLDIFRFCFIHLRYVL